MKTNPHSILRFYKGRAPSLFVLLSFILFNFTLYSEETKQFVDLKSVAGNDTIVGLCGLKKLDGSKSEGDIVSYYWSLVSGPKIINMVGRSTATPMFQAFEGGDYYIELLIKDVLGSEARDTIHYFINPIVAEAGSDESIGACDVVEFDTELSTLGDGYSFSWYPEENLNNANIPNAIFDPGIFDEGKSFTFYFTVTDSFGCVATDEIKIKVGNAPLSDLSNSIVKLSCDTLMLDASFSDGDNIRYEWSPSKSISYNPMSPFLAHVSNEVSAVKVVVVDKFGCRDSSTKDVSSEQLFVNLGPDDSIGYCENYQINAQATVQNNTLTWEPVEWIGVPFNPLRVNLRRTLWRNNMTASDTSKVFPFVLKVQRTSDGCVKSDTLNLTVFNAQSAVDAGEDKNAGVCGTVLNGSVDTSFVTSYYWTSNSPIFEKSENAGKNRQLQPNLFFGNEYERRSISFTLNANDNFGCVASNSVRIQIDQRPIITVSPQYYFPNGCDPVQIQASTLRIDSMIWNPGSDLDDIHAEDPVYSGTKDEVLSVKAYDKYGCEDTGEAHIVWSPVTVEAGPDIITKQYQTANVGVVLNETNRFYEWRILSGVGASLTNSDKSQCRFVATNQGEYFLELKVRDGSGCTVSDTVTVTVQFGKRVPIINNIQIDPLEVIQSDSVSITGDAVSLDGFPITYSWRLPDGTVLGGKDIRVKAWQSGWVVLSVNDGYDNAVDSVYWTVTPEFPIESLEITSPMGDTVCAGEPMSFSKTVVAEHKERLKYLWWIDNQAPTQIQDLNIETGKSFTIYCRAFNSVESLTDSFRVVVLKPQELRLEDVLVCPGIELTVNPEFLFPGGLTNTYKEGNFVNKGLVAKLTPFTNADYAFARENIYGCRDSANLSLTVRPHPYANSDSLLLEELVMMGQLDLATNDTGAISTYRLLTSVSASKAYLTPDGDLTYNADTTMINGRRELSYEISSRACPHLKDTSKVTVLLKNAEGLGLIVTNAFSPNGDNVNDQFIIRGITDYLKNELYIYSKIGLLVYEAKPYLNDWDGKRNKGMGLGQEVPEGTYFYVLKVKDDIYLEGTIEIRR